MSIRANRCMFYHNTDSVKTACYYTGNAKPCKMALNQICKDYFLKSQYEKIKGGKDV